MESHQLYLAPLRGVTGLTYRRCFARHFGGVDLAVSPFLTTVAGSRIKATHLADIDPARNQDLPVIPQVIGKSAAELRILLLAIRNLGYTRGDLNAGCPWPMIVKKGRGAGLLRDGDNLRRMLDAGCAVLPDGFSLKVRLGIETPDLLLQRMDIINAYPLTEVTIHARTARQRYAGHVMLEEFAQAQQACRHRVIYNGDIRTMADFTYLKSAYPAVSGWMIGRGAIADPFLPSRICGDDRPPSLERLRAFLEDYHAQSEAELFGPASLLGRLKELWSYLHVRFEDGALLWKQIRTCKQTAEYQRILSQWWQRAPTPALLENGITHA